MELESCYDIASTAAFIHSRDFHRVALQFPDEMLKDSTKVVKALREELRSLRKGDVQQKDVGLFVMADTTYGSCCVDEVGASHINADCVIHYGHTCLSPTSVLPAFFVFGKATINEVDCARHIADCASASEKPLLVLFGLEYKHAMQDFRETVSRSRCASDVIFADVTCSVMDPPKGDENSVGLNGSPDSGTSTTYSIGGLSWNLPEGRRMEDYLLFWIGSDNTAFSNIVLTFNGCEIVRYDPVENHTLIDFSQQRRILKRRYYLVEKAKDANIIGILVGTLGVAGYLNMIHKMKELIAKAGKKAYTLVMGRPNPAKLANFPECDVFIYVSCAQTALLDSKEFLAPVITPFEAILAFNRGSQWTGSYELEFRHLINSSPIELIKQPEEARFSFLRGGYVEDVGKPEDADEEVLALSQATANALHVSDKRQGFLVKGVAKSGAEFFATRSYQGLEISENGSSPEPYFIGRSGKASGYIDEKSKQKSP